MRNSCVDKSICKIFTFKTNTNQIKEIKIHPELEASYFEYNKCKIYVDSVKIKCKLCECMIHNNLNRYWSEFKQHIRTVKHMKRVKEEQLAIKKYSSTKKEGMLSSSEEMILPSSINQMNKALVETNEKQTNTSFYDVTDNLIQTQEEIKRLKEELEALKRQIANEKVVSIKFLENINCLSGEIVKLKQENEFLKTNLNKVIEMYLYCREATKDIVNIDTESHAKD